jgi:hypothetical protein
MVAARQNGFRSLQALPSLHRHSLLYLVVLATMMVEAEELVELQMSVAVGQLESIHTYRSVIEVREVRLAAH